MTAVRATFSDFRTVKGRKVAQLVMEIPIEQANAALQALGGVPQPDQSQWVGIAPLTREAAEKPAQRLSQKAALLCKDEGFRDFLAAATRSGPLHDDATTAVALRRFLEIASRADLDTNPEAAESFNRLITDFDLWRGRIGETR